MPIPDTCWRGPFALYREAVQGCSEACDDFHFHALLPVIGTALGRSIFTYYTKQLFPNFFVVLVGESERTKKSTAIRLAGTVLQAIKAQAGCRTIPGVSSAEGLLRVLGDPTAPVDLDDFDSKLDLKGVPSLMSLEELSILLRKARQENLTNLTPMITHLYDCPLEVSVPRGTHALLLNEPFLAILSGTTKDWLESSINKEDVAGGFANRFLFCVGEPKPPIAWPDEANITPVTEAILRVVKHWKAKPFTQFYPSPEAKEAWGEFYNTVWVPSRRVLHGVLPEATSRLHEYAVKLAMIYAALDETEVISLDHIQAGIEFSKYSFTVARNVFTNFSFNEMGRVESRILDFLQEQGKPVTLSAIHQHVSGRVPADKLKGIVTGMAFLGLIIPYSDIRGVSYIKLLRTNGKKP